MIFVIYCFFINHQRPFGIRHSNKTKLGATEQNVGPKPATGRSKWKLYGRGRSTLPFVHENEIQLARLSYLS